MKWPVPSIDLLVNEILNQLKNCCSFCGGGFLLYFLKYWRKVVLVRAIFREIKKVKRVVKLRLLKKVERKLNIKSANFRPSPLK